MKDLKAFLRKNHILIGTIFSIPILLTAITGIGYAIFRGILGNREMAHLMKQLHTMEIFGIEAIEGLYIFIVGLSLIYVVVTGLYYAYLTNKT